MDDVLQSRLDGELCLENYHFGNSAALNCYLIENLSRHYVLQTFN
jgi:hypothetical protein